MDKPDSNTKYIVLGSAAVLVGGLVAWNMIKPKQTSKDSTPKVHRYYPSKREHSKRREALKGHPDYDVFFGFQSDQDHYLFKVQITFELETVTDLFLDYCKKGITKLLVNGSDLLKNGAKDVFTTNRIWVKEKLLKLGNNVIEIEGNPEFNKDDTGMFTSESNVHVHGSFHNLADVFPCFEQNDIRGKFKVTVSHPKTWTCFSNEKKSRTTDSIVDLMSSDFYKKLSNNKDLSLTTFIRTKVIPPYSFALNAGEFETFQTKAKFRTIKPKFHFPAGVEASDLKELSNKLGDIQVFTIKWMAKFTGVKYPFSKIDNVFGHFSGLAMEYPGCITYSMDYLDDFEEDSLSHTTLYTLIVHETIHMWFGNLVTCETWDQNFLQEGLTNYLESIIYAEYVEKFGDDQESPEEHFLMPTLANYQAYWMDNYVKDASQADQGRRVYNRRGPDEMIDPTAEFDNLTYHKGMVTFAQVERLLGQKVFKETLQKLIKKNSWNAFSLEHLVSCAPLEFQESIRNMFSRSSFHIYDFSFDRDQQKIYFSNSHFDHKWILENTVSTQIVTVSVVYTDKTCSQHQVKLDETQQISAISLSTLGLDSGKEVSCVIPNSDARALLLYCPGQNCLPEYSLLKEWNETNPTLLFNVTLNLSYLMLHQKSKVEQFSPLWMDLLTHQLEQEQHEISYYLYIIDKFGPRLKHLFVKDPRVLRNMADKYTDSFFELFGSSLEKVPSEINFRDLFTRELKHDTWMSVLHLLDRNGQLSKMKNEIVQTNPGQEALTLFVETKAEPMKPSRMREVIVDQDSEDEDEHKLKLSLDLLGPTEFKNTVTDLVNVLKDCELKIHEKMEQVQWLVGVFQKRDYVAFGIWVVGYLAMWKGRVEGDILGDYLVKQMNQFVSKY